MNQIKQICDQIGLNPRTCIEVGAAHRGSYRLAPFVDAGNKVILVEANPRLYYCLTEGYNWGDFQETWPALPPKPYGYPPVTGANLRIVHAAITNENGTAKFFEFNASSFVAGVNSPAHQNDGFVESAEKRYYEVPAMTIDKLDDGEVDVLLSDTEGCEWYSIKHLISRPRLIVLETHGNRYINPHIEEIMTWMRANGYRIGAQDETDTAFIRQT